MYWHGNDAFCVLVSSSPFLTVACPGFDSRMWDGIMCWYIAVYGTTACVPSFAIVQQRMRISRTYYSLPPFTPQYLLLLIVVSYLSLPTLKWSSTRRSASVCVAHVRVVLNFSPPLQSSLVSAFSPSSPLHSLPLLTPPQPPLLQLKWTYYECRFLTFVCILFFL